MRAQRDLWCPPSGPSCLCCSLCCFSLLFVLFVQLLLVLLLLIVFLLVRCFLLLLGSQCLAFAVVCAVIPSCCVTSTKTVLESCFVTACFFFFCVGQLSCETRVDLCFWLVPSRPMLHTCVRNVERCPFFFCLLQCPSPCAVVSSVRKSRNVKSSFFWCPQRRSKSLFFLLTNQKKVTCCSYHSRCHLFFQVQNAFLGMQHSGEGGAYFVWDTKKLFLEYKKNFSGHKSFCFTQIPKSHKFQENG